MISRVLIEFEGFKGEVGRESVKKSAAPYEDG